MTITFDLLNVLRFVFITGWLLVAGLTTMSTVFMANDREDYIFMVAMWILCMGSSAMLYFGR